MGLIVSISNQPQKDADATYPRHTLSREQVVVSSREGLPAANCHCSPGMPLVLASHRGLDSSTFTKTFNADPWGAFFFFFF